MTGKAKAFISIEMILYVTFISMDVFFSDMLKTSMLIKYIGIVLCFFYVLFFLSEKRDKKDANVVRVALGFTLLADTLLIWVTNYELGVLAFIVVQMCYFYRLDHEHLKSIWVNFFLSLAVCGWLYNSMEPFSIVILSGSFYLVSLLRNVWDSFMLSENRYFQYGLVLFLCCDVSVLIYNMDRYISVSNQFATHVQPVIGVLIWIFYLPSQVLIALSAGKK